MKKIIKLSENDIVNILAKYINEQEGDVNRAGTPSKPGGEKSGLKTVTTTLDSSSLFGNAMSKINTESTEYKTILNGIRGAISTIKGLNPITVSVQGGASAVGSSQGFDNKKLANERATNMINTLKRDLGNDAGKINWKIIDGIVGVNTVKNSVEARKEQFVKVTHPSMSTKFVYDPSSAISTTATGKPNIKDLKFQPLNDKDVKTTYGYIKRTALVPPGVFTNPRTFNEVSSLLSKYGIVIQSNYEYVKP